MNKQIILLLLILNCFCANSETVINVPPVEGDATDLIREVIQQANEFKDENVIISFADTIYNLSRAESIPSLYHISNTTSKKENPDATKHIGVWLKDMENLTIDGGGAIFMTHGEMTSFVIDNCKNIILKNFRLDAADPSVTEIKLIKKGENFLEFYIYPPTEFNIEDGNFSFTGESWSFGKNQRNDNHVEFAQLYNPEEDWTIRCASPMKNYTKAEKTGERTVKFEFDKVPEIKEGERFQLRHGIRNEACMFINRSKDVNLKDIEFNFMGNFGIVSQFSENVSCGNIRCRPAENSERSNAGFADFLQFSSCKGLIKIENSIFEGSQDDPINIHGTHLLVTKIPSSNHIIATYMHPQTFGFKPCEIGDELAFVDVKTLNRVGRSVKAKSIRELDEYNYEIEYDGRLPEFINSENCRDYVIENLTWTPEVIIRGNSFRRTPARAILISTKRKSIIENNVFYHIPMPAILVADDARSWYESGPVCDLSITDNTFIDCSSPVISISPEVETFDKPVHSNIRITENLFKGSGFPIIKVNFCDQIEIKNNTIDLPVDVTKDDQEFIQMKNVSNFHIINNHFKSTVK